MLVNIYKVACVDFYNAVCYTFLEKNEKKYMKDYIKIARVDHWIKQLFIVPGNLKFHWVMTEYAVLGALGLLIAVAAMILCRFWCVYRTKE